MNVLYLFTHAKLSRNVAHCEFAVLELDFTVSSRAKSEIFLTQIYIIWQIATLEK